MPPPEESCWGVVLVDLLYHFRFLFLAIGLIHGLGYLGGCVAFGTGLYGVCRE